MIVDDNPVGAGCPAGSLSVGVIGANAEHDRFGAERDGSCRAGRSSLINLRPRCNTIVRALDDVAVKVAVWISRCRPDDRRILTASDDFWNGDGGWDIGCDI